MAFKLSKDEVKQRDEFVAELNLLKIRIETAIETFNAEMTTAFKAVETARDAYHDKLGAINEFLGQLRDRLREEFDDKTERWREGKTGRAVEGWLDEIEGLPTDQLDIDNPERLDLPDMELGEALAELADNPL